MIPGKTRSGLLVHHVLAISGSSRSWRFADEHHKENV